MACGNCVPSFLSLLTGVAVITVNVMDSNLTTVSYLGQLIGMDMARTGPELGEELHLLGN